MYSETEQKERRRIITFIVVTVILIVVLLVAIVAVAINKSNRKSLSDGVNSSFEIKVNDKDGEPSSNIGKISTESATSGKTSDEKISDEKIADGETANDMPTTGPQDLLPVALALGAMTTGATKLALAQRQR